MLGAVLGAVPGTEPESVPGAVPGTLPGTVLRQLSTNQRLSLCPGWRSQEITEFQGARGMHLPCGFYRRLCKMP